METTITQVFFKHDATPEQIIALLEAIGQTAVAHGFAMLGGETTTRSTPTNP
jgi:hypothetical protein